MCAQLRGSGDLYNEECSSFSISSFLHQHCSLLLVEVVNRKFGCSCITYLKSRLIECEAVMQTIFTSLLEHGTPISSIIIKLSNYSMEPAHIQAPRLIPIQARVD
jgi:hypothetical protein